MQLKSTVTKDAVIEDDATKDSDASNESLHTREAVATNVSVPPKQLYSVPSRIYDSCALQ